MKTESKLRREMVPLTNIALLVATLQESNPNERSKRRSAMHYLRRLWLESQDLVIQCYLLLIDRGFKHVDPPFGVRGLGVRQGIYTTFYHASASLSPSFLHILLSTIIRYISRSLHFLHEYESSISITVFVIHFLRILHHVRPTPFRSRS
jgi:hypothetical protein